MHSHLPVLRHLSAFIALACFLGAGGLSAQTPDSACKTEGPPMTARIAGMKQAGERSFLFQIVRRRLGAPLSCRVAGDEHTTQIDWSFAGDAKFTFFAVPAIEMVNHAVVMPGLTEGEALALLKQGEKSFSTPPCGIDWSKPVREKDGGLNIGGTNGVSYWGSSCNCHGRISYTGQKVIGLALGMAC
jgi:hypothetical protein